MSGKAEQVYVNAEFAGGRTQTDNFTMYVNGYMSVKNGGAYTKHIYAGNQRVVSKLGDIASFGEDPRRIAYAGADIDGISVNFKDKYLTSQKIIKQRYDSLKVPYNGLDNDDYAGGTSFCNSCRAGAKMNARLGNNENAELLQYYYHPDHLGSSSFITDIDGNVAQHVEYVPFGEVFLEEHNNTWQTPYLFNGKELDEETGLYYYGARYYEPKVSLWLSVDPLAEKYPNRSSYEYCASNPVKFVDPDGRDWVEGKDGKVTWNDGVTSKNYKDKGVLKEGERYLGTEYKRFKYWDNKKHKGLVLEHYKSDKTMSYEERTRPDADGKLTIDEADEWYAYGEGRPLTIDVSLLDLSSVEYEDLPGIGKTENYSFFEPGDYFNYTLGRVLGTIQLTQLDDNGKVRMGLGNLADTFNFEDKNDQKDVTTKAYWKEALRNRGTVAGHNTAYLKYPNGSYVGFDINCTICTNTSIKKTNSSFFN